MVRRDADTSTLEPESHIMTGYVIVPTAMLAPVVDGDIQTCRLCREVTWTDLPTKHATDCPLSASPEYEITEEDVEAAAREAQPTLWQQIDAFPGSQKLRESKSRAMDFSRTILTAFVRRLGGAVEPKKGD
jgi:hypothetical protein